MTTRRSEAGTTLHPGLVLGLVLLLLAGLAALWLWPRAGGPSGAPSPDSPPAAPATLTGEVAPRSASQATAAPVAKAAENTERRAVPATTEVRGEFRAPFGVWPGGGVAELRRAPPAMEGGFLEMMGKMSQLSRGSEGAKKAVHEMESWLRRGDSVAEAEVDPSGRFVLSDPPPGRYVVSLRHPRLRAGREVGVEVEVGDHADVGRIDTELAASVLVLVADAEGRGVGGAELQLGRVVDMSQFADPSVLSDMPGMMRRFVPLEGRTDGRGAARFDGLDARQWTLLVRAHDFVEDLRRVDVEPGHETLVRVVLSSGAALRVAVHDEDGTPHARARLRVRRPDVEATPGDPLTSSLARGRRARTGEDGIALVRGLAPGPSVVELEVPGFLRQTKNVELRLGQTAELDLLLARGLVVSGRVVDEQGQPLADAHVMDLPMLGQSVLGFDVGDFVGVDLLSMGIDKRGVPTDADGRFALGGFEAGEKAHLVASAPGHDPARADDVEPGATGVELRLLKSTELTGRVVTAPDGAPLTDFEVRLEQRAWLVVDRPVVEQSFEQSADGRFRLERVPRQRFQLVVRAEGRAELSKSVDLRQGSLDAGELRLPLPSAVAGVVVGPSGEPVEGASVRLSKGGLADSPILGKMLGQKEVATAADGSFRLSGLGGRRVRLLVDAAGFAPLRSEVIQVGVGKVTEGVVLQLSAGGRLRGRVVDGDGSPLAGWHVQVTLTSGRAMQRATTDAAGRFTFQGLASGAHKVDAFPGDYMQRLSRGQSGFRPEAGKFDFSQLMAEAVKWTVSDQVVIREGEESEVELVFERPDDQAGGLVTVEGRVTLGGAALEHGVVLLSAAGAITPAHIAPVQDGRFRIEGVRPGGYQARLQTGVLAGVVGRGQAVQVTEQRLQQLDLDYPGGRLAGRVLQADGSPAAGIVLGLSGGGGAARSHELVDLGEGTQVTGGDGTFEFAGLGPGAYEVFAKDLIASHGAGRCGRLSGLELAAGEQRTGLELRLVGGGSLHVAVRDAAGPRGNALVTLLRADGRPVDLIHRALTDAGGEVTFSAVPDGAYRVLVDAPVAAPEVSDTVQVASGAEARLEVEARRGTEVRVRIEGQVQEGLVGQPLAYAVSRLDGTLLRAGRAVVPRDSAAVVALGSFHPGRYRVRVECAAGSGEREQEVPAGASVTWTIPAAELGR